MMTSNRIYYTRSVRANVDNTRRRCSSSVPLFPRVLIKLVGLMTLFRSFWLHRLMRRGIWLAESSTAKTCAGCAGQKRQSLDLGGGEEKNKPSGFDHITKPQKIAFTGSLSA
jgi:hypothetical protein